MIDSLTSENYGDFERRYSRTYGWLIQDNKELFVYLKSVSDDQVTFYANNNKFQYHARINSGVKFKFIPVKNGWFNASDGNTYLLSRHPARQWKRGIAETNTTITTLDGMEQLELSYNILSSIFNEDYRKLNPLNNFEGRSCALSQHFALGPNGTVYFYLREVGKYLPGEKTIHLSNPIIQQELQDLITRKNWDIKVSNDYS